MNKVSRRGFMQAASAAGIGLGLSGGLPLAGISAQASAEERKSGMKLGMVTYNMGKDLNCPELIDLCKKTGLEGVELRTTHKHGVEVTLNAKERAEVKKLFADSGIAIAGLGSTFEFHSKDMDEVKKNVEGAKEYAQLAADVGAPSIKVRPNGLHKDEDVEKTCERIGKAWGEVAKFAAGIGVEVRMEVHGGGGSALPVNVRKMLDAANDPNAKICWNSNKSDMDEKGSIKANFDLLKHALGQVHITDIGIYQYPWQELFNELKAIPFEGFCLAEIAYNPDPERFMKYYRMLFDLYTGNYRYPCAG
ncbi:MAG TPA: sugar phosphate isomerase/epimerase family protein [Candidatus Hydrogenedentes bacterium]|nr:sugar phosphate isomerase/epimerase family protein [Candidatus Hydrogenedentota bacterium]